MATTSSEKALLAAAGMLTNSARSLTEFAVEMESFMEKQAQILDKISDKLSHMGGGGKSAGGGDRGAGAAIKGFAGDFKSLTESLSDLASAGPKLKDGFTALTNGMKALNTALKVYSKVPKGAVKELVDFLRDLGDTFEKIKIDKIKTGAEAVSMMASSIVEMGLALLVGTLLFAVGAVGSLLIIPIIAGYALLFNLIGRAKEIKQGAKTVEEMGLSLVVFGLALFAVKEIAGGNWKDYAEGAAIVAVGALVFAGIFYLLGGKWADRIADGALAMLAMGLGLASLALGIWSFQLLKIDAGTALIVGVAVLAVGLAMGIVGLFSEEIEAGALALAFSALGLISLALGIASFKLFKLTLKDFLDTGIAVAGVGAAMAAAGLLFPLIALGAAALILAGVSLILLGAGVFVLDAVYKKAMDGLFAGSKIDPTKSNLEMMIGGIVSAFSINPIKSAFMLLGAGALLVVSVAMITLGVGLMLMNLAYKHSTDILSPDKNNPRQLMLETVIDGIVSAFNISPIKSAFMLLGAAGLLVASAALITLSIGLVLFDLAWKMVDKSQLFQPSTIDKEITNFEAVMQGIREGFIMGPLKLAGLYASIPAWIGTGVALITIGAGLAAFQKLVNSNIDLKKIEDNVETVLTSVAKVFSDIGKTQGETGWFSKSYAQKGVDAVAGIGGTLADLAKGVQAMADLKFPIYDKDGKIVDYFTISDKAFDQVKTNIASIVTAIAGVFTDIGAKQGETGWFSKSNATKGKEAIQGVGADLVGIADFVQKAANLTYPIEWDEKGNPTKFMTIDPKMLGEGGAVRTNIVAMINALAGALADVGSSKGASSGLFSSSDIEKGKKAIQGIGQDVQGIADMVVKIAGIKDIDSAKAAVSGIITSLAAAISGLSISDTGIGMLDKMTSYMERLAATADPLEKLASSFEKIAKSMDKFGVIVKKNKDAIKESDMFFQSMTVLAKIDPGSFTTLVTRGQELLGFLADHAAKNAAALATPAPAPAPTAAPATPKAPEKTTAGTKPIATKEAPPASNPQLEKMLGDVKTSIDGLAQYLQAIEAALQGAGKINVVNVNS
jgi:hypothetical protein